MPPRVMWGGILGALIALDLYCDRDAVVGNTFSEVTRDVFKVHTPAGRVAFVGAWGGLTAWYLPHILRRAAGST